MQSTIVLEGPHSSAQLDSLFAVSTSSPSSQRNLDTTLTVESIHQEKESNIFDKYKEIKQGMNFSTTAITVNSENRPLSLSIDYCHLLTQKNEE